MCRCVPLVGTTVMENTAANVALMGMTKGRDNRNTGPGSGTRKSPVCGDKGSTIMTVLMVTIIGLVA